ncbi:large ribosomal subunit protein mL42-like [Saccostrea echinata]|uniref:large ribosomal subunit protein mL42-like n=1 Tax=Saccostrea echinata TaxID=191078 RepID=UPI002A83C842|nr:large ribosomal subunit protein mL42-like [Saccostrea echinata]
MAAPMHKVSFSVFRNLRASITCCNGMVQKRLKSKNSEASKEDDTFQGNKPSVTLSSDESIIIFWHPEPKFPYECSKPMPRDTEDMSQGDSPLKLQYIKDYKLRHRPTGPTVSELANIFYTTKHPFNPIQRTRRRLRNQPPPDRESI